MGHIRQPSRLVFLALTLLLVSCGADAPTQDVQQQPETPAPANPAPAPPTEPVALEWTDVDLEKAGPNAYGPKPATLLRRNSDGILVFRPETADDHVALPFAPLPAYDGKRSLEAVLDLESPGGPTCLANVQDQAFKVIATVPCWGAGEQRKTIPLHSGVTGVRFTFQSPSPIPMKLPRRLQLIERREGAPPPA